MCHFGLGRCWVEGFGSFFGFNNLNLNCYEIFEYFKGKLMSICIYTSSNVTIKYDRTIYLYEL
jgi:hypothetical protein